MPEEVIGAADMAACECEPCKRKAGLPHAVRSAVIHSYTSTPRSGWVARRTAEETAAMAGGARAAATFGVELETDVASRSVRDLPYTGPNRPSPYDYTLTHNDPEYLRANDAFTTAYNDWDRRNRRFRDRQRLEWAESGAITAEEAVSLAAPRGLWHAKHDGSVSGPEFASQPATLAYWRSQRSHIATMFRSLLHGGLRSHDGDRCGLHINIGTDAFGGDANHLERFAALVVANPRWSTRMSQRTHASARQWAPFATALTDPALRREWAESVARYGYASQNRYAVLNASNTGRIEFRLPRGTLRVDRFYAKVEWVAAMVEFTRDASNVPNPTAFTAWVQARRSEYPALVRFMRERFPARFESAVAA